MLTGNLLSIGVGGMITVGWSLISPADFDWEITRRINAPTQSPTTIEVSPESPTETPGVDKEKASPIGGRVLPTLPDQAVPGSESQDVDEVERMSLQKAFRFAAWSAIGLTVVLILLIPLPLFFSSHSMSPFTIHAPILPKTSPSLSC